MISVSIIIPAYNEEKRIGKTLEEYCNFFKELKKKKKIDFEILIVINNTTDKTEDIVKKFQKKFKEIRYLNFKQGGKGFAIIKGFEDALKRKNDLIGFVDADMATSPRAFSDVIRNSKISDGAIASRWIKGAKVKRSFGKYIRSRGFNFFVRVLFLMPYRDTQCGAKLFKRHVVEEIIPGLSMTQWAFDINLLYMAKKKGFKIKEIPTIWEDKEESKINNIKTPVQMALGILRLRLINSPFEPILRPIKFILSVGDKLINK